MSAASLCTEVFCKLRILQADDKGAGIFLDHLSRNRSLKTLHLQEHFLLERKGRALADAIRNHATLEELKVKHLVLFCWQILPACFTKFS